MDGRVCRDRICCVPDCVCCAAARPRANGNPANIDDAARARSSVVERRTHNLLCHCQAPQARNHEQTGPADPVSHVESAGPYDALETALDRYLAGLLS